MSNLRELILAVSDLPSESLPIPEWGMSLNVRAMTGAERDAFEADNYKRSKKGADFSQSMQNIGPGWSCARSSMATASVSLKTKTRKPWEPKRRRDGSFVCGRSAIEWHSLGRHRGHGKKLRNNSGRYFAFLLAKELGMTVRELLMRIDSSELTEWQSFFS